MDLKELIKPTTNKIIAFYVMSLPYIIYLYAASYFPTAMFIWKYESPLNYIYVLFLIFELPLLSIVLTFIDLLKIRVLDIFILPLVYNYVFVAFTMKLFEKSKWKAISIAVGLFVISILLLLLVNNATVKSFGVVLLDLMKVTLN